MNLKREVLSLALCAAMTAACVGAASGAEVAGSGVTAVPISAGSARPILVLGKSSGQAYGVTVAGKPAGWAPFVKNGRVMAPLKALGQALGFPVAWDETTHAAKISNADCALSVFPGTDAYVRNSNSPGKIVLNDPVSYGAACEIRNGRMYVPIRVFELLGAAVTLKGHTVEVSMPAQLPNPVAEYSTVAEAARAAGFSAAAPQPAGLGAVSRVSVIAGKLLQIDYAGGICYRVERGESEDISGDYDVYGGVKTVAAGKRSVTLKSDGSGVRLALWRDGDCAFSLRWESAGATESAALAAAVSVA